MQVSEGSQTHAARGLFASWCSCATGCCGLPEQPDWMLCHVQLPIWHPATCLGTTGVQGCLLQPLLELVH
jgi:hypothetical protein